MAAVSCLNVDEAQCLGMTAGRSLESLTSEVIDPPVFSGALVLVGRSDANPTATNT